MCYSLNPKRQSGFWLMLCFLLACISSGCHKEEIQVYTVPKENPHGFVPASSVGETVAPHLDWKLPEGWTEQPSQGGMRMATFSVAERAGQQANVAIIGLPAGRDSEVINILRDGIGLPPLNEEGLGKLTKEIQIGPGPGKLFTMEPVPASTNQTSPRRILVAMLTLHERSWFFTMSGADAFVLEQKPVFLEFLSSISVHADDAHDHSPSGEVSDRESTTAVRAAQKSEWNVPANWRELPTSQFLLAKFDTTGDAGTKAEISISSLAGNGGGILANVNRWRHLQLGLSAATESDLPQLITTLDASAGKAMLVDMTGKQPGESKNTRIVGAILPQGDRTWFFKMMGDDSVLAREKAAFIEFVRTVKVPNAP